MIGNLALSLLIGNLAVWLLIIIVNMYYDQFKPHSDDSQNMS